MAKLKNASHQWRELHSDERKGCPSPNFWISFYREKECLTPFQVTTDVAALATGFQSLAIGFHFLAIGLESLETGFQSPALEGESPAIGLESLAI